MQIWYLGKRIISKKKNTIDKQNLLKCVMQAVMMQTQFLFYYAVLKFQSFLYNL